MGKIQPRHWIPSVLVDSELGNATKKTMNWVVRVKRLWRLVRPFHEISLRSDGQLADGRTRGRLLLSGYSFRMLRKLENRRSCTIYRRICSCRRQCSDLRRVLQNDCRRHLTVSLDISSLEGIVISEIDVYTYTGHKRGVRSKAQYRIFDIPHRLNLASWLYVAHQPFLLDQVPRQGSLPGYQAIPSARSLE